ncbi:hypothetical protein BV898_15980 [Hypsibius exemplaris]|uniref:G-protein coupled receptors family 1 profile domain-containing protein n=1 Tax=Hypsibius exemplaris TaxID=2072580 RepID=A0A9X6RL27_HYPEX|nr:hypothetical protein BV898_15980 [Hypsibius exemplaris]
MPYLYRAVYRHSSHLFLGDFVLSSECGVEQDDPMHRSDFYLDDGTFGGTFGGTMNEVLANLNREVEGGAEIGLELNLSKCEAFLYGGDEASREAAATTIHRSIPNLCFPSAEKLELLGAPLLPDGIGLVIGKKFNRHHPLTIRLCLLAAHQALFLLKNCLAAPKMLHLLRCLSTWTQPDSLVSFDTTIRNSLAAFTNTAMTDAVWKTSDQQKRSQNQTDEGPFLSSLFGFGNLLNDNHLRIIVALRLGAIVCQPHPCQACKKEVREDGHHALLCAFDVAVAVTVAIPPFTRWSSGLYFLRECRQYGSLRDCAERMGSGLTRRAAQEAEANKHRTYAELEGQYIFVSLAFKTFGTWGGEAKGLISDIGRLLPVCILLTFFIGLIGNAGLLVVFITHRPLWTPFNVYVVNLLVADCCCIALQFPLDFITDLYGGLWPIGEAACSFYVFATTFFQALIFNSHQLIAVNRIWAVAHPISYRHIHSVCTACYLCAGVWLYVFVGTAPGVIQDSMYYREPADGPFGCMLNTPAQMGWGVAVQIIYFNGPQFTMLLALVLILMAKRRRTRLKLTSRSGAVAPSHTGSTLQKRTEVEFVRSAGATTAVVDADPGGASDMGPRPSAAQRRPVQQRSHGNLLLVFLTFSVTINLYSRQRLLHLALI